MGIDGIGQSRESPAPREKAPACPEKFVTVRDWVCSHIDEDVFSSSTSCATDDRRPAAAGHRRNEYPLV